MPEKIPQLPYVNPSLSLVLIVNQIDFYPYNLHYERRSQQVMYLMVTITRNSIDDFSLDQ